ncbi:hypothetical protein D3C87_49330 [compost metagenome]
MRHSTKFYYVSYLLICFLFIAQFSYADGSKDLYPSGKTGRRAYLRAYTTPTPNWPFANDGTHFVYAKVGEVITLASSAQSTGGNSRIRLFAPSGTQVIDNTTDGQIANRTAELAGPRFFGQAAGGNRYLPIYHTVTTEGIYRVEFVARGTGDPGTSYNADANWTEANDAGIRAWDVSVINTTNDGFISGRTYVNVLNLTNGLTSPNTTGFEGILHILTKDGYTYRVNNNGNNGLYFTFLVNNNGFLNQSTQEPIYKSLNTTTGLSGQIHDPNTADNSKQITQKLFYALPANDLPTTGSGAVPGGNTWLKNAIVLPEVTDVKLVGVDGTVGQVSNRGGYIRFTAGTQGNVAILIESTESPVAFAPRTITGFATSGVNNVLWDGKDGTGTPMPAGNVPAKVTISLQGAEVHFPFFDMEYNSLGTIIELLDHNNLNNVVSDLVYWNDTGISPPTSGSSPSPINNSQLAPSNSTGISSNSNGHKWGVGGSGTGGLFGDNRSIDTWTFIKGANAEIVSTLVVKIADLKISEITPNKTAIVPGDNVTYTVKVKNDGPSNVEGAPFTFVIPTGFNPQSFTFSGNGCGTEALALSYDAATRTYSSRLDLPNGCEITYNVTVSVTNTTVAGNQQVTATILRPNDVTDPDATSNITPIVPPTDPYVECANNGLGVACNNILNNTDVVFTNIPSSPGMRLTKTGTYADSNGDGKVNVGDKINYTFKVENTGNVSLTDISISDPKVTVSGGPVNLAPNAVDNTSFTAVYTLTQADVDKGGVYNLATATGKDPSNNPVTDESESGNAAGGTPGVPPIDPACPSCTITPLPSSPGMRLTKNTTAGTYNNIGDVITYTLKVKNTGNVTLKSVIITDTNADVGSISPNTIANLNVGAEITITAKHTLVQADLDKGFVYNIANAAAKDPKDGNVTATSVDNNPAYPGAPVDPACPTCTITEIKQNPAIALIKKVTNAGTGENGAFVLGNQIEYTFTVTNTGNVSLKDLVLSDPLVSASSIGIPGVLLPGTSVTRVERYTITAGDIARGSVTNQATVSGTDPKNEIITDKSGTSNADDIATVTAVAKPPVANDNAAETKQNFEVKILVLDNDVPGSSPVVPGSIVITTPPKNGTVTVNTDGTVSYKPNAGYAGVDDFSYTVKDKNGQVSTPAKVTVTIVPTKPVATDDSAETQWNTEVNIPVSGNDKPDGSPFDKSGLEIAEQPKHGTLRINADGTVTYLPNSGYTGKDTFSYRIKDENGNWSNVAIVNLNVKGFFIPNVITPNGDGKNDNFVIVGLENFSNVELTIFNRWGNEVYRNKNYQNTWTGDGLNEGTYYYLLRMSNNGKQEVYKGWVLIKR